MKKGILLLVFWLSFVLSAFGTEKADSLRPGKPQLLSHFTASLELQTKYVWRGIEYGTAPTLFPSLSYSTAGFNAYVMGGYSWNGSHSEVDLGVSYTYKGFTLGVNDYYYPTSTGESDKYFNYKGKTTGHWFEGTLGYSYEKLPVPLWALVSTYFAGADKRPESGKQAWSTYAEIGGRYDFKYEMYVSLAVGAALNKSFYNDYAHGFSVCNVNLRYGKTFAAGPFTFPLGVSFTVNPLREKVFISFNGAICF